MLLGLRFRSDCFSQIRENIEKIYNDLTVDNNDDLGGRAILYLENKNEPFNGGVIFNPTPPNKRFTYDLE